MSFIREIAEVPVIFDLMNGVIPIHRTELLKYLNPFVAGATEWYDTYCFNIYDKRKKKARESALIQFVEDVSSKFEDIIVAIDRCDDECFRRAVIEYLDFWLGDFITVVKKTLEAIAPQSSLSENYWALWNTTAHLRVRSTRHSICSSFMLRSMKSGWKKTSADPYSTLQFEGRIYPPWRGY